MEEEHTVSIIGFVALWVSCVEKKPLPALEKCSEPHHGENSRAICNYGVGVAPEETSLFHPALWLVGWLVGPSVLLNKQCRDQKQPGPFEGAGLCLKINAYVSTKVVHS